MPLDGRARTLNRLYEHKTAQDVLAYALSTLGDVPIVSSFGAESVVLLHMAAQIDKSASILFIDTEMLFEETLQYQKDVAAHLGLTCVDVIKPTRHAVFERDVDNLLHLHDPDACCDLRKTTPLQRALAGRDGWITGRKRYHGGARAALEHFEVDRPPNLLPRLKVNPLAHWDGSTVRTYFETHDLPRHPLVAQGYPSIGCAPCTARVNLGDDVRSGRWKGQDKTECGIHFEQGRLVRPA